MTRHRCHGERSEAISKPDPACHGERSEAISKPDPACHGERSEAISKPREEMAPPPFEATKPSASKGGLSSSLRPSYLETPQFSCQGASCQRRETLAMTCGYRSSLCPFLSFAPA